MFLFGLAGDFGVFGFSWIFDVRRSFAYSGYFYFFLEAIFSFDIDVSVTVR